MARLIGNPGRERGDQALMLQRPPARAARALGWLLAALAAAALLGALLIPWPEVVESPFTLTPFNPPDALRSPVEGLVERVAVSEGARVEAGQTVMAIRAKEINAWQTTRLTLKTEAAGLERRRDLELKSQRQAMAAQEDRVEQSRQEALLQAKAVETHQDLLGRLEKLSQRQAVSGVELMNQRLHLARAMRDLVVADKGLALATRGLEQLRLEQAARLSRMEDDLAAVEARLEAQVRLLADCQDDLYLVKAPVAGQVLALAKRLPGEVVSPGQEMARLVPAGAPLKAELSPPEEGLARLSAGQRAQLLLDAFPHQRFGVLAGRLAWLGEGALPGGAGRRFLALVELDRQDILVDGRARPLQAGMGGRARIKVGTRTAAQMALEPLRRLRHVWPPE